MTENEGDLADAEGAEAPAGNAEQTNKPDGMDID